MKNKQILFLLCSIWLTSLSGLFAQDRQDSLPQLVLPILEEYNPDIFSLETPRRAVSSHLRFLQQDHYFPDSSAKAFYGDGYTEEEREKLAIKLKQIYDGEAHYIYVEEIPDDPNFTDSLGRARFNVFPKYKDIFVEKVGDQWIYSKKTVKLIPAIHDEVFPFGTDFLVRLTPKFGQIKFLGLRIWQWIGIFLLIAFAWVVYRVFNWVASFLIQRVIPLVFNRMIPNSKTSTELIHSVAKPFSLLLVTLVVQSLFPVLQLPIALSKYAIIILQIGTSIFGVMTVYRMVDLISELSMGFASRTQTALDDQLIPLVRKIVKLSVVVLGIIFILQNLDINVTALLAGVSIGGLALALAAQDTVKNFIGSLSIFIDQPFQIGDFIETSSLIGSVVEVGVRSTRIRSTDGSLVSIPNGELVNLTVTNHGLRTYRRYTTNLGLTYDTTPDQIEAFVEGLREIVQNHPKARETGNNIYFHEMADSTLNIHFQVYFELTAYAEWLAARQDLLLAVMRLAEKMDISFAFPSTSVYVESMPATNEK